MLTFNRVSELVFFFFVNQKIPTNPNITTATTPPPINNLTGKERSLSLLPPELCWFLSFLTFAWISFQISCWNSFIFSLLSNLFKSFSQSVKPKSTAFKPLSVRSLVIVCLVLVFSWVIVWLSSFIGGNTGNFGWNFLLLLVIIYFVFLGSLVIFWTFI